MCEERERRELSPFAAQASNSKGRKRPEEPSPVRTCYQRDTDRIVHSKAFRRLMHKTQVFLQPEGDHYRTRMTHTWEVSRIARTIARGTRLNEDLAEAISLGHDLGHTPFGHAGERALNSVMPGGFRHNEQSLRVAETIEREGEGLNLCYEVLDGLLCHTGEVAPQTLEGRIIRYADRIAYINHDIDDAIRAGILRFEDIPEDVSELLGSTHSERINALVTDVILNSQDGTIGMSAQCEQAMAHLRTFLFERVYMNPVAKGEERKIGRLIAMLFEHYCANPSELPHEYREVGEREGLERAACDYIAGMTDKYALFKFDEIFVPKSWTLLD
jgi:dGTPase